jgi:hypothetical protein
VRQCSTPVAGSLGGGTFRVVVLVVVVSTSPPTTRLHTPPLSWLGLGPPGELTNALDEVKKDVLTVFMVAISDVTALPPVAAEKPRTPVTAT